MHNEQFSTISWWTQVTCDELMFCARLTRLKWHSYYSDLWWTLDYVPVSWQRRRNWKQYDNSGNIHHIWCLCRLTMIRRSRICLFYWGTYEFNPVFSGDVMAWSRAQLLSDKSRITSLSQKCINNFLITLYVYYIWPKETVQKDK
jgi:hypothetical protein